MRGSGSPAWISLVSKRSLLLVDMWDDILYRLRLGARPSSEAAPEQNAGARRLHPGPGPETAPGRGRPADHRVVPARIVAGGQQIHAGAHRQQAHAGPDQPQQTQPL